MENNKDYSDLVQDIDNTLKDFNKLQEDEFQRIIAVVENLIETKSNDLRKIEYTLDSLFELMQFERSKKLYLKLFNHLESIDPALSDKIRERNNELSGKFDHIIEEAKKLAKEIHAGQSDKAGMDYFSGHLSFVGDSGCTWKDKVVGYLHDAAEDTAYSVEQILEILQERCNREIIEPYMSGIREALHLLNSKTATTREEYISRIRNSKIATRVKLNDLIHNMDISRIPKPSVKDIERLKRYKKEYRTILEYLNPVCWD